MKPHTPKPLKWNADPMFLIPVAIIVAIVAWTIVRRYMY